MINIIWSVLVIFSILYAFFTGRISEINYEIIKTPEKTISFFVVILGSMSLWNGIMKIAINSSVLIFFEKMIYPFVKVVFPKIKKDSIIYKNLVGNIFANLLGLGNAATILGLKCMNELKKENKNEKLTKDMNLLIIMNTASLQIIPTTIIAIRENYGSSNPSEIILPIWIVTSITMIVAITLGKIFIKE